MVNKLLIFIVFFCINLPSIVFAESYDPLPSWKNTPVKQQILHFVDTVTDKNSKGYVAPEDRIATFDNDGTLLIEQPMYTQFLFTIQRYMQLEKTHPAWQKTALSHTLAKHEYHKLTDKDFELMFSRINSGLTPEEYQRVVKDWLATAKNKRFDKPIMQLVYRPMLEVIHYLQRNHFQVYIVTGSEQGFVRTFSKDRYQIASQNVIGTTISTSYQNQNGHPVLFKMPSVLFVCNYGGKAEAIQWRIGKKPIIAFGNSDGDRQMLEWTQSNDKKHMMLLVHHDDAKREYAYDSQSKIGTFSKSLFNEALQNHWEIISMKNDWKVVF